MSIAAIATGLLSLLSGSHATAANDVQQFQTELEQLGHDLQSGNLQAAQQDFSALQLDGRQAVQQVAAHHHHLAHPVAAASASSSSPSTQPAGSLALDFRQLAQSLQTGNLQAAQQAFSTLQSDLERAGGFAASGIANTIGASGVDVNV